jgi:hypothetical protein
LTKRKTKNLRSFSYLKEKKEPSENNVSITDVCVRKRKAAYEYLNKNY